jgi:hypothetical protein
VAINALFQAINNTIFRTTYIHLRPSLHFPHAKQLSQIIEPYVKQFEEFVLDDLLLDFKLSIAMGIWQSPY